MAKRVRIKIDKKGIGQMLKGQDTGSRLREELASHMGRIQSRMEASLPEGVTVDRRDWVGFDRARATAGIPGWVEARDGTASRSLG